MHIHSLIAHRDVVNLQWTSAKHHPLVLLWQRLRQFVEEDRQAGGSNAQQYTALIVDVGANVGQSLSDPPPLLAPASQTSFILFEARSAHVYKLERLRKKMGNRWAEIRVVHAALSRAPERNVTFFHNVELDYGPWTGQQGSLGFHAKRPQHDKQGVTVSKETVNVTTLDNELPPPGRTIDWLKVDTEGFDNWVLFGGAAALSRTRVVLIELSSKMHSSPTRSSVYGEPMRGMYPSSL